MNSRSRLGSVHDTFKWFDKLNEFQLRCLQRKLGMVATYVDDVAQTVRSSGGLLELWEAARTAPCSNDMTPRG